MSNSEHLARLDHEHVWHPFTAMKQWRQRPPLIIERGDGEFLIDTEGRRYIDGVSSLWCNVHGHCVPEIDCAVRDQLAKIAHTTLLGLASPPSIELAAMLVERAPRFSSTPGPPGPLNQVFYSDAGATAVEVAAKMAVGYWYHRGQPRRHRFIGLAGAYHGDTMGAMSVGYSELLHRPFRSMLFPVSFFPAPDACRRPSSIGDGRSSQSNGWPSEDPDLGQALSRYCLGELEKWLRRWHEETAAVVMEPVIQGAAGMITQPSGFVRGVAKLARQYGVLLIADEVATGFCRTGRLFACEHDEVQPDILCVAKGLSGGYLPLAATLVTDEVADAFAGEWTDRRALYHGHTYTGNALACAAAIASLKLIDASNLVEQVNQHAGTISKRLAALRDCPQVLDIRHRGIMVGIELCKDRRTAAPLDHSRQTGAEICSAMRPKGLIVRPLGDVIVLMPVPAVKPKTLSRMLNIVVETILSWDFGCPRPVGLNSRPKPEAQTRPELTGEA